MRSIITITSLFGFSFLLLPNAPLHAQSETSDHRNSNNNLKKVDAEIPQEGTYQITVENRKIIADVSDEDLKKVTRHRKQEEVHFIEIDEYTTIKVLPYSTINSDGFVPLKKFSYKDEN